MFLKKRKEPKRGYCDVFSVPRENIVCDLSECEQRHSPHTPIHSLFIADCTVMPIAAALRVEFRLFLMTIALSPR